MLLSEAQARKVAELIQEHPGPTRIVIASTGRRVVTFLDQNKAFEVEVFGGAVEVPAP